MSRLFFAAFLAAGLMTCTAARAVEPANQPSENVKNLTARIDQAVGELSSKNAIEVQAAQIKLSVLPMDAVTLLEAAAKKPGIPADALARLNKIIAREREMLPARKRLNADHIAYNKENLDTALAAYEKAGTKNPKWDADARMAIELFITPPAQQVPGAAQAALEKVINEGCNDPFILYLEARTQVASTPGKLEAIMELYERATAGFEKSQYPVSRKIRCYAHDFSTKLALERGKNPGQPINGTAGAELNHLIALTAGALPAVADEKMTGIALLDLSETVLDTFTQQRKQMFDALYGPLEKKSPDDTFVLTVKGEFYVNYAWDARGMGFANTVTPEGWKKMAERLDIAADALTKAWEKDNGNATAASTMLNVELGQNQGRNRMELWFNRAMKANPDDRQTCLAKLNYLEPKWHGSPQDMIIFGHQCLEGGNWSSGIPTILVEVHKRLAAYSQSPQQYFAQPQVWNDIESVYLPLMQAEPSAAVTRSFYCSYACRAGKWAIAKKQFDLLGDKAVPAAFGGVALMQRMHDEAEQQGASAATP